MTQQLFRVSAKDRRTGEEVHLHVWAENNSAATDRLCEALFGKYGPYTWTGTSPEYENNEVIKREI